MSDKESEAFNLGSRGGYLSGNPTAAETDAYNSGLNYKRMMDDNSSDEHKGSNFTIDTTISSSGPSSRNSLTGYIVTALVKFTKWYGARTATGAFGVLLILIESVIYFFVVKSSLQELVGYNSIIFGAIASVLYIVAFKIKYVQDVLSYSGSLVFPVYVLSIALKRIIVTSEGIWVITVILSSISSLNSSMIDFFLFIPGMIYLVLSAVFHNNALAEIKADSAERKQRKVLKHR